MSSPLSLLSLPPEIRLQIYEIVLGPSKPLLLSPVSKVNTWTSPPLSRVCQQLRHETLHLHFHTHDFIYDLRSPLSSSLVQLEQALKTLYAQDIKLRGLRFKHVNRGILSTCELTTWVRIMAEYRSTLPSPEMVTFCQGPLRYREFAAQAAAALRQLVRFAAGLNEAIFGSGEESAVVEWIEQALARTEEGRVVLRGVRFAEDVVRGFREAARDQMGAGLLGWTEGVEVLPDAETVRVS